MTENKNFLTIPKGRDFELRFGYSDFKGVSRLDVRQWVPHPDTRKMIPTKAGLSIPLDEIDSFMNAMERVIPQIREWAGKKLASVEAEFMNDPIFNPKAEDVQTLNPDDLKGEDKWG